MMELLFQLLYKLKNHTVESLLLPAPVFSIRSSLEHVMRNLSC